MNRPFSIFATLLRCVALLIDEGASHMNFIVTATIAGLLALAGCQSARTGDQGDGLCRAEAANALAGKKRVDDAAARQLTGATIVRQVRPGDPVQQDLVNTRLTIETDPKTDTIVRAYCG